MLVCFPLSVCDVNIISLNLRLKLWLVHSAVSGTNRLFLLKLCDANKDERFLLACLFAFAWFSDLKVHFRHFYLAIGLLPFV